MCEPEEAQWQTFAIIRSLNLLGEKTSRIKNGLSQKRAPWYRYTICTC